MNLFLLVGNWIEITDGDPRARALYLNHYSARHYRDGRRRTLFVGPGEKLVFLTLDCQSLFVWRKFRDDAIPKQTGVNNADFIHHGEALASDLIVEACELAWRRWPGERFYTYVDAEKTKERRSKRHGPGIFMRRLTKFLKKGLTSTVYAFTISLTR